MRKLKMGTHEQGVIDCVTLFGDTTTATVSMNIRLVTGGVQEFRATFPTPELRYQFVAELCSLFHVARQEELVGKPCFALRCWPGYYVTIEGLQLQSSSRYITITGWKKRNGIPTKTPLEKKREELLRRVGDLRASADALEREVRTYATEYVAWDAAWDGRDVAWDGRDVNET